MAEWIESKDISELDSIEDKNWIEDKGDGEYLVKTCAWSPPGDHPVGCGMILTIKDGKLAHVEGDPEHPITKGRLCPRCLALTEAVYNPDRIIYPMKRDPSKRGDHDAWERCTWDEALDMVEEKVRAIWAKEHGHESIVLVTGTGREACMYAYSMAEAVLCTVNWGLMLGGNSCYAPRGLAAGTAMGIGYPEIDYSAFSPLRYEDPEFVLPKYILVWGKMPLYSSPDGIFGHVVVDLMQRGTKIINVDPRINWLSSRAEYALQLRPGTDAALGLGMLNIIISEDLYDHDFVDKWCYGFEELAARAAEYPVERVAEITGIEAETILAATRAFATSTPCSGMWGLAIDEHANGNAAAHAFLCILAITGNFDIPGGNTLAPLNDFNSVSLYAPWRQMYRASVPDEDWQWLLYSNPIWKDNRNGILADDVIVAMETADPYPIRMMWLYGTNLTNCPCAEPARWEAAMKKLEFNVCQDFYLTPAADSYCDLFLPVSSFVEHEGIVVPHFGRSTPFIGAMNKAITVGEAKSDIEINFMFGKRLNPDLWPWDSIEEFFTFMTEQPPYNMTFKEFQNASPLQIGYEYRKYETGKLRPDGKPGFNTATGRIELWRTAIAAYDQDPLPAYEEPPHSPVRNPEEAEKYPLILTTGQRNILYFHSEGRQIPSLRTLCPDPTAEIHPEAAKKYGIVDGGWMCIENWLGKAVYKAVVTPAIREDTVAATHGWWFPEEGPEGNYGMYKSNINELISHGEYGPVGCGTDYKATLCRVYPVDSHDYLTRQGYPANRLDD